jgi:hypothetical protein
MQFQLTTSYFDNEVKLMNQEKILKLAITILVVAIVIMGLNSLNLSTISKRGTVGTSRTGVGIDLQSTSKIAPTGVPKVYGVELGVSYDDISVYDQKKADSTIRKLAEIDKSTELSKDNLDRYITILYKLNSGISCEYCCGARSIIFSDGKPACGCAHSYAMRGLAKYLITKHGDEYNDQEIQEELAKWKFLFFPAQMNLKFQILKGQDVELSFSNIGSNTYRGIEKGVSASGGMAGGC